MLETKIVTAQVGTAAVGCSRPECSAVLDALGDCFRDESTGRLYCPTCGPILRYHRKKALQRGETLPITMADVNARLERLTNNVQSH